MGLKKLSLKDSVRGLASHREVLVRLVKSDLSGLDVFKNEHIQINMVHRGPP